jgi:hypothetical protein
MLWSLIPMARAAHEPKLALRRIVALALGIDVLNMSVFRADDHD